MKRLEALCDAIAFANHYTEPESEAYEIRNPGMLAGDAKNPRTAGGKRIFSCHRAGYAALLDVAQKRCMASPDQQLAALLEQLNIRMRIQQEQAIDFMARCANSTLTFETPLQWFIEISHDG